MRASILIALSGCTLDRIIVDPLPYTGTVEFAPDDDSAITGSRPGPLAVEPYVADSQSDCDPSWVLFGAGISLAAETEIVEGRSYEIDGYASFPVPSGEYYWLEVPEDCSVPEQACSPRPARATLEVDELPADGLSAAFRVSGSWCFGDIATQDGVCDDVTVLVTAGDHQAHVVDLDQDSEPSVGKGWPGYLCLP